MLSCFNALIIRLSNSQHRIVTRGKASHVLFNSNITPRLQKKTMATQDSPVPITAAPSAGQSVEHNGKVFTTVREGKAYILVPPNARTSLDPQAKSKADNSSHTQNVFYNPIQQFNRDLSVLAIKAYGEDARQKKSQRLGKQHEQNHRRRENKRKRKATRQENGDREEGGVKLRRTEASSSAALSDPVTRSDAAQPSVAGANQVNNELEGSVDGGAAIRGAGRPNGITTSESTIAQQASTETVPANGVRREETNDENNSDVHPQRPKFRILDALSATGLRALRYASEIPYATEVVANDRETNAVKSINLNIEHNKLSSSITATTGDALGHMYSVAYPPPHSHGPDHVSGKYDVIDLDPYGTATPFIDASLQALEDGGLLCVTSTDSGVFASCGYSEKTFSTYGGLPIKGIHSHEGGLRLVLHSIATTASKYGLAIEPLLSLSIDFYVRLFIRLRRSPLDVKFLSGKTMLVYGCDHGCGAWTTQSLGRHTRQKGSDTNWKYSIAQAPSADRLCEHCGSKMHLAGPMWAGPLHNPAFIEKMLDDLESVDKEIYQTKARIEGMLDTALDELTVNSETMDFRSFPTQSKDGTKEIIPKTPPEAIDHHPFFFIPSALCKVIRAQAPSEALLKGALRHAGYRVTRSHCKAGSIKTDAPWTVIWEIMREWVRQKAPIREGALQEIHPGWKILQAMRKADENGDTNGDTHANGTENSTTENTPDIVTEASNGTAPVPTEQPTDVKRMRVIFDEKLGKDKPGKRLVRYQENPRENWGPMKKAKGTA